MISEALFDDNKVYIHDAFLQGYFLTDDILERVVARNGLTERDKTLFSNAMPISIYSLQHRFA